MCGLRAKGTLNHDVSSPLISILYWMFARLQQPPPSLLHSPFQYTGFTFSQIFQAWAFPTALALAVSCTQNILHPYLPILTYI